MFISGARSLALSLDSMRSVAAAILAAVEGGILPPGKNARLCVSLSAGQDVRLYGRRDARRYPASLFFLRKTG